MVLGTFGEDPCGIPSQAVAVHLEGGAFRPTRGVSMPRRCSPGLSQRKMRPMVPPPPIHFVLAALLMWGWRSGLSPGLGKGSLGAGPVCSQGTA